MTCKFDDRDVAWQTVASIGAQIYVLAADEARGIVDVLIRFEPDTRGKLHQHVCEFSTLVLQGELRFWRPDGSFKEVRPSPSYVQGVAHGEPHAEGAGQQMAVVLFSFRGTTGDMVLYLDDDANVVFRLTFADFQATLAQQVASGVTAKLAARPAA